MESHPHLSDRIEELRLEFGFGRPVDAADLGHLVSQLRAGTEEHADALLLYAFVLSSHGRYDDSIAILKDLVASDDSNAEIRAYLAADLRIKGIEDARAVLAQASPDGLDDTGRLAYWTEILQTELAAWDAERLSALLDQMPEEDQKNELLKPVIEAAKVVLDFVRSYPTRTTTEAE